MCCAGVRRVYASHFSVTLYKLLISTNYATIFSRADVISTDLRDLIPLLELNKKVNKNQLRGKYEVLELKW